MTLSFSVLPDRLRGRPSAVALVLAMAFLLGACATFQRPAADADYGPPPSPYKDTARAHIKLDYAIPDGSRLEVGKPVKAYINNGLGHGGEVAWLGYLVDVTVSAPDAKGVLGEPKPYMVFFNSGRVVRTLDLGEHPLVTRVE